MPEMFSIMLSHRGKNLHMDGSVRQFLLEDQHTDVV